MFQSVLILACTLQLLFFFQKRKEIYAKLGMHIHVAGFPRFGPVLSGLIKPIVVLSRLLFCTGLHWSGLITSGLIDGVDVVQACLGISVLLALPVCLFVHAEPFVC